MRNALQQGVLLAAVVGLGACGGGNSTNNGNNGDGASTLPVTSTLLEGVAIDGYLQQAKVCLDLNDNLVCEAGEPSAVTDAVGRYRLNAPNLETANAHRVVVEVIAGQTIDVDVPTVPVANGYVLTAPVGKHGVISPLTTLAHQLQVEQPVLSVDEAAAQLRDDLALTKQVDIYADFAIANASTEQQYLHDVTRVVARLSGESLKTIAATLAGGLSPSDKQAALKLLWQRILAEAWFIGLQLRDGVLPDSVQLYVDVENMQQQLAVAALREALVSDPLTALANGFGLPSGVMAERDVFVPVYRLDSVAIPPGGGAVDTQWRQYAFDTTTNGFIAELVEPQLDVLKEGRWTRLAGLEVCRHVQTVSGLHATCSDGAEYDISMREIILDGQSINAALRAYYDSSTARAWSVAPDKLFSSSARAYRQWRRQVNDLYMLPFVSILAAPETVTTLDQAMASYRTGGGSHFWISMNLRASFDSVAGSGGELSLALTSGDFQNRTTVPLALKGYWERKRLGQEEVLEFSVPDEYLRYIGGKSANMRLGWTVYAPSEGRPIVTYVFHMLPDAIQTGTWLNAPAIQDLKTARGTAAPAT